MDDRNEGIVANNLQKKRCLSCTSHSIRISLFLMAFISIIALLFIMATPITAADENMHIRLSWRYDPNTTVSITWDTDPGLAGYVPEVRYGMEPGSYTNSKEGLADTNPYAGATIGINAVELSSLYPETRYYYICGCDGFGWSDENSFVTPPVKDKGFTFAACGDSRQDPSKPADEDPNGYLQIWGASADDIDARAPLFTLFGGDMIYTYPASIPDTEALWNLWFERLEPLSGSSVFMSTLGNHETDENAYLKRMALPPEPSSGRWYSFDVSNVHFVCLNTGIDGAADEALIEQQVDYLDQDLAQAKANGAEWTVVYFHKVAYSTLTDITTDFIIKYWVPVFEKYNVDLVIQAHKHYYERSYPVYEDEPTATGNYYTKAADTKETVYVIAGSAGAPLYDPVIPPSETYPWLAAGAKEYHYCIFDVTGNKIHMQTFNLDGDVIDEFWIEKPKAKYYLAEGSTAWGFDTYISIENPNDEAVTARINYMGTSNQSAGILGTRDVTVSAMSQATLDPRIDVGKSDFSTTIECLEGKAIAAERTMSWTGPGAASPEAHTSIGVTSPSNTWYLPEGSSAWGFETWLLVQNPNDEQTGIRLTYMTEDGSIKVIESTLEAASRATFSMADAIGATDASIKVESDLPVIAERSMYRNNRREGHCSIGTMTPSTDYYLSEGTTAWGFTTYVMVQNPNAGPASVTVTYMTPEGPEEQEPFTMAANSRRTIRVNDALPNTDFSTLVYGSIPIIAERSMYWGGGTPLGEACHNSIGMSEPHTTFYLPDGQTGGGYETWTLVQNPNDSDVEIEVTYITSDGTGNVSFTETIDANSRSTFNMADQGINRRAAVLVECVTEGKKIMAERAIYWNNRGAGTETIGGYSD